MGMKMAISAISSFPIPIDENMKTTLQSTRVKQMLKLELGEGFVPFDDAVTFPERKDELFGTGTPLDTLVNISPTHENLPVFLFLSCFDLLIKNQNTDPKPESKVKQPTGQSSTDRLVFALKCSIALGLAVLLGMLFDKKNGYWSGLTIAISFVKGTLPIFTVANNRIHGTAIGSVYGVLGSILLHQVPEIRFIILLPWIVFTSMLQHSQMFGESGGIAAVIGALLILGRKNYGPPKQFAIARLTEVSIGLFCMVLLEVVLHPVRAATKVKLKVSRCLGTLDECLNEIASSKENIKKLKSELDRLKNVINIANLEPSFWFLPFKASCYENTKDRLSKMVDLMEIMSYNIKFISSLSQGCEDGLKEVTEHINGSLEILKHSTSPSVKCLQKIMLVRSNKTFDQHLQESEGFYELESGSQPTEEATKVMNGFVHRLKVVMGKVRSEDECKRKLVIHLNSLGFCIGSLVGETMEIEKCIKEIIRCENPEPQVEFDKTMVQEQ
ncbi:uncharacterized protein LOC143593034 [Bidens hawaiensis]|uniref:uncharacterized protein LOC143593034 n=1 Tax=Bidens hawaiensis TaxID=980011 RepID=UPI00404B6307